MTDSLQRAKFFVLVDDHVRTRITCFLAELDFVPKKMEYQMCFRRTDGSRDSAHRYDCKYVRVPAAEVTAIVDAGRLTPEFKKQLSAELSSLKP